MIKVFRGLKEERVLRRAQFACRVVCAVAAALIGHAVPCAAQAAQPATPPSSPLAIHVGDADLLIGGFLDAMVISRSTNTGNGIATNFGNIPFKTTTAGVPNAAGNLSE